MKAFWKKYQDLLTKLLLLSAMLGTCFGAVIYIQEAPNKAIAALAQAAKEADDALEAKIVREAAALRTERAILKDARDKEVEAFRVEVRNSFTSLKSALDRIEQRQYDQRKRAEKEPITFEAGG